MLPTKPVIKKQLKFVFVELLLVYLVVIILMVASCHRTGTTVNKLSHTRVAAHR